MHALDAASGAAHAAGRSYARKFIASRLHGARFSSEQDYRKLMHAPTNGGPNRGSSVRRLRGARDRGFGLLRIDDEGFVHRGLLVAAIGCDTEKR